MNADMNSNGYNKAFLESIDKRLIALDAKFTAELGKVYDKLDTMSHNITILKTSYTILGAGLAFGFNILLKLWKP